MKDQSKPETSKAKHAVINYIRGLTDMHLPQRDHMSGSPYVFLHSDCVHVNLMERLSASW